MIFIILVIVLLALILFVVKLVLSESQHQIKERERITDERIELMKTINAHQLEINEQGKTIKTT